MTRLRQAVVVAANLDRAVKQIQEFLGLDDPYPDPGVGEFGLANAVFSVGDTFLEVVSPLREGTTAGRYLARRGDDAGYMAIFQVPDVEAARTRIAELGVRVVWQADLADISGTHLHPADVPGAIVSIDSATPPETWHWAGPKWTGSAPAGAAAGGGLRSLTVGAADPPAAATRWAAVLGITADAGPAEPAGPANGAGPASLTLNEGRQQIRFVAGDGISEIVVSRPGHSPESLTLGAVAITIA